MRKGERIGRMGHSGRSSGPHLHIHALRVRPDLLRDLPLLCEKVRRGDDDVGALRPLQFRGVATVHDLVVFPGGAAANPVTMMDGHGAYFDTYVVWP